MKISQLTVLSLAILTIAGCGSIGLESKRVDYKAAAVKAEPLDVPPDLTAPAAEDHYAIPDGSSAAANYSDFAKGNISPQARVASVLPVSRTVHWERNGSQRWLVVDDKVENIWPVIVAFWKESGFVIKTENMQSGIIETDWTENRAKIPMEGLRKILGKVIDNLYDSGERDMYHVRLERSKDGNSTEIYLAQYGKEEVLSADKNTTKWISRPNDPELEASMLQLLMTKLVGSEAQSNMQAEVQATGGAIPDHTLQTLTNGSKVILLSEPFDRSWRRVGLALEHEGYIVEDKNRANGVYFLHVEEEAKEKSLLDKLAFWRKEEISKPARYQVTVHESKEGSEVAANNGNGGSNANSQRIIEALFKALGK